MGEPGPEARMSDPGSSPGTTHGLPAQAEEAIIIRSPFLWAPFIKEVGAKRSMGVSPPWGATVLSFVDSLTHPTRLSSTCQNPAMRHPTSLRGQS